MSVFYRLSKVTSPKAKGYGKWYPRAVITQTVDTEMLATIMQRNCTLKRADIVAVITELIETMADQLQDSKRVKLNGFGSFKIGIHGEGANSAADFSVSKNIKDLHVLFQPEVKTDGSGVRQKTFITGCSVQEAPKNDVDTTKPANNGSNSGNNSGNTGGNTQPSNGGGNGDDDESYGD
ncbi:DNA-binding protein, histone-like, putative [Xylanibacter ruminicola]|jgi:predicted histone-like DNA-binding protein|uniref:DNA-binding protein, histone-like, putative n=1 Tax=Xylanibacter ruminicola TaxID=839 RepID=A0A1H4CI03_XYLRU|nr:HU family DNA-binding protein [Xylanibacter ruminicola]SEA59968.1 DNA-binding protein, histone-like, putative [Xylanibacter ruminicola]